jgi:hypothetical protein
MHEEDATADERGWTLINEGMPVNAAIIRVDPRSSAVPLNYPG